MNSNITKNIAVDANSVAENAFDRRQSRAYSGRVEEPVYYYKGMKEAN